MPEKLAEYLNWSDSAMEKYDTEKSTSSYAELSYWLEGSVDPNIFINLRRETATRRNFTVIINAKNLYEFLKNHFEG